MWKIGNVEINSKVVLAPMAGVTSLAYRNFMKPFGVGLTVTEMVSDYGLVYGNKKTLEYIKTSELERPVAVQLFGSNPDVICKAIDIVLANNKNIDIIDINMGCPMPKVTKGGAGSALLKDPLELEKFMRKIVEHSPLPVTAKIRLGLNESSINYKENIKALERAGVSAIAIHARTTSQMYSGSARYDLLENLRDEMEVPLIVSGDIFTLDDAINALKITKADAVMVARGSVGNPTLIKQIDKYFSECKMIDKATLKDNIAFLEEFTNMLIDEKGEYRALAALRGIAPKFLDGYPGMKKYKIQLAQSLTTKQSLKRLLDSIE